jgi:hypothetical protein
VTHETILILLATAQKKKIAMDSAERCRSQLAECRKLLPLAKSEAESTVLKNLVRSWKMIANQMALRRGDSQGYFRHGFTGQHTL